MITLLRSFSVGLVDERRNAGAKPFCLHEFQGCISPVPEQTLSASQNNGKDQQVVLIDEVVLHQRLHKFSAAKDHDILTGLLLQLGDFVRDILVDQS